MAITTDLDRVRLMIGDTEDTDPLLSDDEVGVFIDYRTDDDDLVNLYAAAADACSAIAAKFARKFNFAEDTQRFDVAQRHSHYLAMEQNLRNLSGGVSVPITGTTES